MTVRALVIAESREEPSLARILEEEGDISAVTTRHIIDAAAEVSRHHPDVVVMVPGDEAAAIEAIEQVMARQPVPILLLAERTLSRDRAISAGAVDVMTAPRQDVDRAAAVRRRVRSLSTLDLAGSRPRERRVIRGIAIVGIAASTGGPQALATVLAGLKDLPAPILVVQHIHPDFIGGFQTWMDRECPLPVTFASDKDALKRGHVYIAPANVHLKVASGRRAALDPEPQTLHRPSADVLFTSIAEVAGRNAVGVLLTGMGDDGVQGLLAIREAGGRTIVQDQGSSAVYGMPRAAALAGAAERIVPLGRIAAAIVAAVRPAK